MYLVIGVEDWVVVYESGSGQVYRWRSSRSGRSWR